MTTSNNYGFDLTKLSEIYAAQITLKYAELLKSTYSAMKVIKIGEGINPEDRGLLAKLISYREYYLKVDRDGSLSVYYMA